MYVTYITSDEYALYAGVSLTSLLKNNVELEQLKIFLLVYDLSDINKQKFQSLCKEYERELEIIYVNEFMSYLQQKYSIVPFNGSCIGYTRMFPVTIFPEYVDRLLYLDSDTIIVGGLKGLEDFSMDGYAISMVENLSFELHSEDLFENEREAFLRSGKNFNNGVILFNLKEYKEKDIESMIDQEMKKGEKYAFAEQSILNCAIPGKYVKPLPVIYNSYMHIHARTELEDIIRIYGSIYDKEELWLAENQPVLLHYLGLTSRPWFTESTSRCMNIYLEYKEQSNWRDAPQKSFFCSQAYKNMKRKDKIKIRILIRFWHSRILYLYKKRKNVITKW